MSESLSLSHHLEIGWRAHHFCLEDLHVGALVQSKLAYIREDVDLNFDIALERVCLQVRTQGQVVVQRNDLVGQAILQRKNDNTGRDQKSKISGFLLTERLIPFIGRLI